MSNLKTNGMKTRIILVMGILVFSVFQGKSQNLLQDGDFESSVPNGTWPSSGAWISSWYPYNAGAITTSTAALKGNGKGNSGLWMYTSSGYSFSRLCQEFNCEPLKTYKAQAWLRSPWNQSWTFGTKAYITISFLNSFDHVIESANSDTLQTGNTNWKVYSVVLEAPESAKSVKFEINLESSSGQSILNADECVLSGS